MSRSRYPARECRCADCAHREAEIRLWQIHARARCRLRWHKVWLVLALATAVGLVCAGIARAQMVAVIRDTATRFSEPSITYGSLAGMEGITICYRGQTYSYLKISSAMSAGDEADTRAHEAMHRRQAERLGGCDQLGRVSRSRDGLIAVEAEAFHAGSCAAIALGADPATMERRSVHNLLHDYPPIRPTQDSSAVLAAYRRFSCTAPKEAP